MFFGGRMNLNLYSTFLFILSIGMLILFIYSLFKNKNRLATIFFFFCLSMLIYNFFYAFELMSTTLNKMIFFIKLEYFGLAFIPSFWFLLAYKFYFKKSYNMKLYLAILSIPFITLIMVSTNEFHHLFYNEISIKKHTTLNISVLDKGIWYVISSFYSYLIFIIGQILFFKSWKKTEARKKVQSLLLLIGGTFPLGLSVVYLLGLTSGIDPVPIGYVILFIFYYIAIFKFELLEMKDKIRDTSFEQVDEGIIVVDMKEKLIDFNNAAKKVFIWLTQNNIGSSLNEISDYIFAGDDNHFEVKYDNKIYFFRTTYIHDRNKVMGKIYIFQDITERKSMINKLEYNARYDFLSQVYNRHQFFELAEMELYKSNRYGAFFSLLMLDIDLFKRVNDKYGHIAGDTVIKVIAKECKIRLRPSDIIGRYGGEEFLILLPSTSIDSATIVAENLRNIIEKSVIEFNQNLIKVTVSIGVSCSSGFKESELKDLIHNADVALYRAKNNGRNCVEVFNGKSENSLVF